MSPFRVETIKVQQWTLVTDLFAEYVDQSGCKSFHVEPNCLLTDNKVWDGIGKSTRLLREVADEGANLELGVDFGRWVSHENRQGTRAKLGQSKVWPLKHLHPIYVYLLTHIRVFGLWVLSRVCLGHGLATYFAHVVRFVWPSLTCN